VALPLTLFTGTDQLTTVIHDGEALGAGLLIAVVFAKILAFALCEATGFIGGPFLVMLFIGGTAGITGHVLLPGGFRRGSRSQRCSPPSRDRSSAPPSR
jgi:H+/Cl- antiporter ClcA